MKKDTLGLKSLILPVILLFCLIAGRKYIYEAGTNNLQLLPFDEHGLMVSMCEIEFETERIRSLSDMMYSKLENPKLSDGYKTNLKTLKEEIDSFYHQITSNRIKLIQDNGGMDERGHYVNPFRRRKFSKERAYTLYDNIESLTYKYELGKSRILVDNEGFEVGVSDFKELYCNAPFIILMTNLSRFELRIAKLEYDYLLYIAKKYKIEFKNV